METDREYEAKKRREERETKKGRGVTVYPIKFRSIDLQKIGRLSRSRNKSLSEMVSQMIQEYEE